MFFYLRPFSTMLYSIFTPWFILFMRLRIKKVSKVTAVFSKFEGCFHQTVYRVSQKKVLLFDFT